MNILVLGFYDRANTGDEMYKLVLPRILSPILPAKHIRFVCTDDIDTIDDTTQDINILNDKKIDCIICGGGEIINWYFMKKIQKLVKTFHGPIYAVSVSLSSDNDVIYLDIFDHVFMRSKRDHYLAEEYLGEANCTFIPDIVFSFSPPISRFLHTFNPLRFLGNANGNAKGNAKPTIIQKNKYNIGICLAQPVFHSMPYLIDKITELCERIFELEYDKDVHLYFFAFNHFSPNYKECDVIMNDKIVYSMHIKYRHRCSCLVTKDPVQLYEQLKSMNINICMRYHSVVFSLLANVPFISVYNSRKVEYLLKDLDIQDNHYKFTDKIDVDAILTLIHNEEYRIHVKKGPHEYSLANYTQIRDVIQSRKYRVIYPKKRLQSFDSVFKTIVAALSLLLRIDTNTCLERIHSKGVFDVATSDIARMVCYAITNKLNHPCIWGLVENMKKDTFVMYEAIKYIYTHEYRKTNGNVGNDNNESFPQNALQLKKCSIERRCLVCVDPYVQNDLHGIHRSGWQYVVDSIMTLDAPSLGRTANIILDTYVDRTFLWGANVLQAVRAIPYTSPWIGIIHHTFDESHGPNNCKELFKSKTFLLSLQYCKCLIVLSAYLKEQVEEALEHVEGYNVKDVEVKVLYHPTEFVDTYFTMEAFLKNEERHVTQIGAWLRNPYAIYRLPLDQEYKNELGLRKAVLCGKNMDGNSKPRTLFTDLYRVLHGFMDTTKTDSIQSISRSVIPFRGNAYSRDMYRTLVEQDETVILLEYMDNEEYDVFLSQNIVFLQLNDCSAVNTVIECIVRHTPLIVNRHPALEEILGTTYPGFYTTLLEATLIMSKKKNIAKIHSYLKHMDKTKLRIDTFMNGLMDIVVASL